MLVIPIVSIAFATAGALISLVPVRLLVTRRLRFDAITAMANQHRGASLSAST